MNEKARAHAKKVMNFDDAVQASLAETGSDLEGKIASFGKGQMALKMYLQQQFKSRKLLRNIWNIQHCTCRVRVSLQSKTISSLRMNTHPVDGIMTCRLNT
jgi:hypothetical protein